MSGLKSFASGRTAWTKSSHLAWDEWIEIRNTRPKAPGCMSHSIYGEWVEMSAHGGDPVPDSPILYKMFESK